MQVNVHDGCIESQQRKGINMNTTTKAAHTPTQEPVLHLISEARGSCFFEVRSGDVVLYSIDAPRHVAHAVFSAVNSHDALCEALREELETLDVMLDHGQEPLTSNQRALLEFVRQRTRAALSATRNDTAAS
jgi:hypothetical protein